MCIGACVRAGGACALSLGAVAGGYSRDRDVLTGGGWFSLGREWELEFLSGP
jgi:hypothetical protein